LWTHFANRSQAKFTNSIGCYMTSHFIGFDYSQDPTGREVLANARQAIAEGAAYADMPLGVLWHALRCYPRFPDARILAVSEIITPPRDPDAGNVCITEEPVPEVYGPRFSSLGMYVREEGEQLSVSIQYATDFFAREGAQNLLRDLVSAVSELGIRSGDAVSGYEKLSQTYPQHSATSRCEMGEFVVIGSDLIPQLAIRQ
jgi:hypothetical protein